MTQRVNTELDSLKAERAKLELEEIRTKMEIEKKRAQSEIDRNNAEAKQLRRHFTQTGGFYAAVASALLTLVGLVFAISSGWFDNSLKLYQANKEILAFEKGRYEEDLNNFKKQQNKFEQKLKQHKEKEDQLRADRENYQINLKELEDSRINLEKQQIGINKRSSELEKRRDEIESQEQRLAIEFERIKRSREEVKSATVQLENSKKRLVEEKSFFQEETNIWRIIASIAHPRFDYNRRSAGDELKAMIIKLPSNKKLTAIATVENWVKSLLDATDIPAAALSRDPSFDSVMGLLYLLYEVTTKESYWNRIVALVKERPTTQNAGYFITSLPQDRFDILFPIILEGAKSKAIDWSALEGLSEAYDPSRKPLDEMISASKISEIIRYARDVIRNDQSSAEYAHAALCRLAPNPCVAFLPEVNRYSVLPYIDSQFAIDYINRLRQGLAGVDLFDDDIKTVIRVLKDVGAPDTDSFEVLLKWIDEAPYSVQIWRKEEWSDDTVLAHYK